MKINIKATNMDLTDAIREYVEKKLSQVDEKLISKDNTSAMCDVEVGKTTNHHKKGDIFRAEFNLHVDGIYIRAESKQQNLYAAIDTAKDELFRSLRSKKNKGKDKKRKGMSHIKRLLKGLKW
tara:strand:+ start:512 stop:880 length:369 start_codon:yes stop_codon:yes gene_type:complete